jgi:hypothetical protein
VTRGQRNLTVTGLGLATCCAALATSAEPPEPTTQGAAQKAPVASAVAPIPEAEKTRIEERAKAIDDESKDLEQRLQALRQELADESSKLGSNEACGALIAHERSEDEPSVDPKENDGQDAAHRARAAENEKRKAEVRRLLAKLRRARVQHPCPVSGFTASFRYGGGFVTSAISASDRDFNLSGWAPAADVAFRFGTSSPRLMPGVAVHFLALPDGNVSYREHSAGDGSYVDLAVSGTLRILTGSGFFLEPSAGLVGGWTTIDDLDALQGVFNPGVGAAFALGWDKLLGDAWALGGAVRVGYSHTFPTGDDVAIDALATTLEVGVSGY